MSEPVLLPCPFCGGKAGIVRYGNSRGDWTQYVCHGCSCILETGETSDFGTRWNQRVDLAATEQARAEDLAAKLESAEALLRYYDLEKVIRYFGSDGYFSKEPWREEMESLAAQLATARADAMEEAAKVCEHIQKYVHLFNPVGGGNYMAADCADLIRTAIAAQREQKDAP